MNIHSKTSLLTFFYLGFTLSLIAQDTYRRSHFYNVDSVLNIKDTDSLKEFSGLIKNDFSTLWLSRQDARLGFIGKEFKRFYLYFNMVKKDRKSPSSYFVKGVSKVGDNVCDLNGTINIVKIRAINTGENNKILKPLINEPKVISNTKYMQFIIYAEYFFKENPKSKNSGIFKGIIVSSFYLKNGTVRYNDLDFESDKFSNNSFLGLWRSYNSNKEQKCCWGDYRIPDSGDLDIGDGEFCPNPKYLKNGWENYYKAYINDDKVAQKIEGIKWWRVKKSK